MRTNQQHFHFSVPTPHPHSHPGWRGDQPSPPRLPSFLLLPIALSTQHLLSAFEDALLHSTPHVASLESSQPGLRVYRLHHSSAPPSAQFASRSTSSQALILNSEHCVPNRRTLPSPRMPLLIPGTCNYLTNVIKLRFLRSLSWIIQVGPV